MNPPFPLTAGEEHIVWVLLALSAVFWTYEMVRVIRRHARRKVHRAEDVPSYIDIDGEP